LSIYLANDKDIGPVHDFFCFNGIEFTKILLWDTDEQFFLFPKEIEHSILIIDHLMFIDILKIPSSKNSLIEFCNRHNQLWVFGSDEHALSYVFKKNQKLLQKLDDMVNTSSVLLILEAEPSDRFFVKFLKNIKHRDFLNWHFGEIPRLSGHHAKKCQPRYDYLLTMKEKPHRQHRTILWNELCARPGLLDRGLASYTNKDDDWLGETPRQHTWRDGYASMDLYEDCYLEIVPETCYRDIYYFTEKTYKPLVTRTPFLIVSTAEYLTYLKELGFRTFDSLIDESYDQQHRVEDRVRLMTDTLEDIIRNGAGDFYTAAKDITDHNFFKLCEITGGWQYKFDEFMSEILDESLKFVSR
jgi:hypothetical protein